MISARLFAVLFLLNVASIRTEEVPKNFSLPKSSKNLCFIALFNLTLNVEYPKIDGSKNLTKIPMNNETFSGFDGDCLTKPNEHGLTIYLFDNLTSITFNFLRNEKNQTSLSTVSVQLTIDQNSKFFPNHSKSIEGPHIFLLNESLFQSNAKDSYRCFSKSRIANFPSFNNLTISSIDIEDLRVQSFVDSSVEFKEFGPEKICPMDFLRASNLIPIIVGFCLASIVVAVLVTYLIRRRRERQGYQSV